MKKFFLPRASTRTVTLFFISILLSFTVLPVHGSNLVNGIPDSHQIYHEYPVVEECRIRVDNSPQGLISISYDKGRSFSDLGQVLCPANYSSYHGYTASKWSNIGTVAATAVNAMHIKVDFSSANNRGAIISILPRESYNPNPPLHSTAIYTNIKAGSAIFGEQISPYVGNPVFLVKEGSTIPLPKGYVPATGDVIEIQVLRPLTLPKEIIFENRFGGKIYWVDEDDNQTTIGLVHSPVLGIGRFLGTQYVPAGRIRANHSGVIDVSTSPVGTYGGFQIIPVNHAQSPEMSGARFKTQWMVIGPLNAEDPSVENMAPFFSSFIKPSYNMDDWSNPDWLQKISRRYLVQIREKEGPWISIPQKSYSLSKPLPASADHAFEKVTHIRILFPVHQEEIVKYYETFMTNN